MLQGYQCDETEGEVPAPGLPVGFRWVEGGAAPEPPTPGALAAILYARVQALMVAPAPVMSPPATDPAVVRVPVFVAVSNWQGVLSDDECVLGVCVTLTATPRLEFDPGEPDAEVVSCEGPGTRWDPGGPPAVDQAAVPGACMWTYRLVSGTGDRPERWGSAVTVRWSVAWEANSGATGVFPELAFSTPVDRLVNEVQTVVADDE